MVMVVSFLLYRFVSANKNAAPWGAAYKPQYALFLPFLQRAHPAALQGKEKAQSACLRRNAGMS
jgi:hypothetical protein